MIYIHASSKRRLTQKQLVSDEGYLLFSMEKSQKMVRSGRLSAFDERVLTVGPSDRAIEGDNNFWFGLSTALLALITLPFILGQLILMAGWRLDTANCVAIWVLTVIASSLLAMRLSGRGLAAGAVLVVAALAIGVVSRVTDESYDGQAYHFDAIIALARGWNPFRETVPLHLLYGVSEPLPPWVEHYPKGSWIPSATLVNLGLSVEAAKPQTLIILVALFCATYALLRQFGFTRLYGCLIAAVFSANPIILTQIFSRMLDGILTGSLGLAAIFGILAVLYRSRSAWIGLTLALILAINVKFTAIPIAVVLCLTLIIFVAALHTVKEAAVFGSKLLLVGVFSVFIIGFHPYVTNTVQRGHPLYPALGEGHLDMASVRPPYFNTLSPSERLVRSYFGVTSTGLDGKAEPLKVPFVVYPSEVRAAGLYDLRIGGFGPLFSGILVLVLAAAVLFLFSRSRRRAANVILTVGGAWLLLSLVQPESWWARYAPQIWFSLVIIAVAASMADRRGVRLLALAAFLLFGLDAALVMTSSLARSFQRHRDVTTVLREAQSKDETICLHVGEMHARLARLSASTSKLQVQSTPMDHCKAVPETEKNLYAVPGPCRCP